MALACHLGLAHMRMLTGASAGSRATHEQPFVCLPHCRPTFSVVVEILHGMLRECRLGERARSAALAEAGPQQAPCTPPRQEVLQDTAAG